MKSSGFTLVELVLMLTVLIAAALGVWLILNPLELKKRLNDSIRLSDLAILQQAVNNSISEATISGRVILCPIQTMNCKGSTSDSDANKLKSDGSGWVKADLSTQKSINIPTLPIDPVNNGEFNYRFYSDGKAWEIDTVLESSFYRQRMVGDGGNNDSRYEVGTNLTLIN